MTTELLILRHGPTAWNDAGRIQGRADIPLSPEGRRTVARWRLPAGTPGVDADWLTSPLVRAVETARLLGVVARPEPCLTEMAWGEWEGRRLADLRRAGILTAGREAAGLDFRPPGGESPRDVQARLKPWLARRTQVGRPTVAIAHKGVIRALYALAAGWDMVSDPPIRLRPACAHRFRLGVGGAPELVEANIPL